MIAASGQGNSDTVDGKAGTNTLQLSAGTHTLTTDNKLKNISKIEANASGSTLDLTNQTENFTIDGAGSADVLKGGGGTLLQEKQGVIP